MAMSTVSAELITDLLCAGNGASSMIWIGASSYIIIPSNGRKVVKGCSEVFALFPVNVLNIVDFPVFGNPARIHCIGAFFIVSWVLFPDFFLFSTPFCSFFIRVVRFFRIFSLDLCFGHSFIMMSRHLIRSSSEVADW